MGVAIQPQIGGPLFLKGGFDEMLNGGTHRGLHLEAEVVLELAG
jgi:hypothetical protein